MATDIRALNLEQLGGDLHSRAHQTDYRDSGGQRRRTWHCAIRGGRSQSFDSPVTIVPCAIYNRR
jgi:hypothetical protein